MDQNDNVPPVSEEDRATDFDVMDVSPAATIPSDSIITDNNNNIASDENKENNAVVIESTPLLTNTTVPQHEVSQNLPQLTDSVTPTLTSASNNPQQNLIPPSSSEDENRDTQFAYVLRKYHAIAENRVYSPWHYFGGFKWRLLIFPRGNHSSNHDLSVYLECGGPIAPEGNLQPASVSHPSPNGKESVASALPANSWTRPAKFSLHLVHPLSPIAKHAIESDSPLTDPSLVEPDVIDSSLTRSLQSAPRGELVKETSHIFRNHVTDWGFLEFASFNNLQPGGYADDDMNVVIMVKIKLQEASLDHSFTNNTPWDSRKETGLVGFKNQGATCYMNSLLQTLYMLSAFRKAVYNMPLPDPNNDNSGSELSYALQKVFYELQFSPTVVKTKKLTESFGWDTTDAFTQHDVQELKLILCDELAEKMKKIAPDRPNSLSTLFQGKILNYIECVNVPYKSAGEEDFSDLSLNVKGCRNISESFEKYTEVEMMDGDNKYRADGFDELQDARKGVKFLKLPPVLQLHLKRFEYDMARETMVKINDRYEFETEIDLSRFVEGSKGDDIYLLHSVLVHIGDVNGGHYHAFIRPEIGVNPTETKKSPQWFKFDDETVTPASEESAVQENYGIGGEKDFARRGGFDDDLGNGGLNGQNHPPVFQNRPRNYQPRRLSNAYMLQYLRKSDLHYLLTPAKESDVPKELAARITKEREEEEQRKRDNVERHLYMTLAVATDDDMLQHHGADLVNWEKVRSINVKRATKLGELKLFLQKDGIVRDARRMRLWKCTGRQNLTTRPDSLLANGEDSQPIDSNYRDALTHGGYNVPLYTGRHGYYGHEEVLKLYVEDLSSEFCLDGGATHAALLRKIEENGEKVSMEMSEDEKPEDKEKLMSEGVTRADLNLPLPLTKQETLLFVKYYSSKPVPRLQWLGHLIVNRGATVRSLFQTLRKALADFHRLDVSLPEVSYGKALQVYEEVSVGNTKPLSESKTLEAHQIPWDNGSGGDIIVFQEVDEELVDNKGVAGSGKENIADANGTGGALSTPVDTWNGYQEQSRGDGTDFPLGGRPLPLVTMYYDYLAYRVKIEFKDRLAAIFGDDSTSIFFELSRKDTYRTARKVLSGALGTDVDPDHIRFFSHDFNREAPAQDAFRVMDSDPLERLVSLHSLLNTGQPEYRTIWYEVTEYHISEFEEKDEVRVVWRPDGGTRSSGYMVKPGVVAYLPTDWGYLKGPSSACGENDKGGSATDSVLTKASEEPGAEARSLSHLSMEDKHFSVLVPPASTYKQVMNEVRSLIGIIEDVELRMMEVKNSKILRLFSAEDNVPALMIGSHDYGSELRVEPVPVDETAEALGEDYDLMSVVHLAKEKTARTWRGLTFFGDPFVVKVNKQGEPVEKIRQRIQEKMGVPSEYFDTWTLYEISQLKAVPLEEGTFYKQRSPLAMEYCALAIERKSTAPPKHAPPTVSRYADKPLKIRS